MTGRLAEAHATSGAKADARAASARFVRDPTSWRDEALRYALSAAVAAVFGGVLIHTFGTRNDAIEASESEHAILIDLPAALSSSQPASDAQDGPPQEALEAAPPTLPEPAEERQADPTPVAPPKPPDPPKPEPPEKAPMALAQPQLDLPPPVEKLEPVEPTPPKPVEVQPPTTKPPPVAPPSPAAAEQAPTGSETPVTGDHPESDEGQPHASARAITAWQRSLVGRLEMAKRLLPVAARRVGGTVLVAFAIDRDGRIVSERVAHSSGSSALDDTALSLVRRASPFPSPPNGTGDRDLSFIVPIRFKH